MTYPTDPPAIAQRAGLGPAECVTCGAATLAAPGVDEPHCDPCRRARIANAELTTAADMLAILASRAGQLGLSHRAAVERHVQHEAPAVVPVKIRILERARDVTSLLPSAGEDSIPRAARLLAKRTMEYGRRVRLTYALAEDMTKHELLHSLCVRVWTAEGARFGYAAYVNGRFSSAVLWGGVPEVEGGPRRANGIDEFAALALGQPWSPPVPPPTGPCPTCGKVVRWKTDGQPYRHKAEDGSHCFAGQEA